MEGIETIANEPKGIGLCVKTKIECKILLNFLFSDKEEVRECIKQLQQHLNTIDIDQKQNSKYYNAIYDILVELIDNISRHGQLSTINKNNFSIIQKNNNLFLKTTGYCKNEDYLNLKNMDKLNELPREDIKQMYLDQMRNGELSSKGGAGLGYLNMAKRIKGHFPNIQGIFKFKKIKEENDLIKFQMSIRIPTLEASIN